MSSFRAIFAGLLAFLGTLAAGVGITILVIRAIPPDVPHPTEAYEGYGDYVKAMIWFWSGAGFSLLVAGFVGLGVAVSKHVQRRLPRDR